MVNTDRSSPRVLAASWLDTRSQPHPFISPSFCAERWSWVWVAERQSLQTVALCGDKEGVLAPLLPTAAPSMRGRRLESWIFPLFLTGFIQPNLGQAEPQKVRHYSVVQWNGCPSGILGEYCMWQQLYCNSTTYNIGQQSLMKNNHSSLIYTYIDIDTNRYIYFIVFRCWTKIADNAPKSLAINKVWMPGESETF